MCNAYKKLTYSTKVTTLMHKMATFKVKLYDLTSIKAEYNIDWLSTLIVGCSTGPQSLAKHLLALIVVAKLYNKPFPPSHIYGSYKPWGILA